MILFAIYISALIILILSIFERVTVMDKTEYLIYMAKLEMRRTYKTMMDGDL